MRSLRILRIAFPFALIAFFVGCTSYTIVTIPPRVDLQKFNTVGVITFDAGKERGLAKKCTQRFIEDMQGGQPGVLVLELGTRAELLSAVGKTTLDTDALKAIAAAKSVTGILFAQLDVAQPQTEVGLKNLSLSSVNVKKTVKASLVVKLWLGENGALAWSDSARGEWTLARASLSSVRVADPDDKYNQMVEDLAWAVTRDFRPTKERRAVEK